MADTGFIGLVQSNILGNLKEDGDFKGNIFDSTGTEKIYNSANKKFFRGNGTEFLDVDTSTFKDSDGKDVLDFLNSKFNSMDFYDDFDNPTMQLDTSSRRFDIFSQHARVQITGTINVTNNSTIITGTGTLFLSEVPVGSYILAGSDVKAYRVNLITNDTNLTIDEQYKGATTTGSIAKVTTPDKIETTMGQYNTGVFGFKAGTATLNKSGLTITGDGANIELGSTNKIFLKSEVLSSGIGLALGGTNKTISPFRVTMGGDLFASSADISGNINANTGTLGQLSVEGNITIVNGTITNGSSFSLDSSGGNIAGWIINSGILTSPDLGIMMKSFDQTITITSNNTVRAIMGQYSPGLFGFKAGDAILNDQGLTITGSSATIELTNSGKKTFLRPGSLLTDLVIGAGTDGNPEFKVRLDGQLFAIGATISGNITANSGTIGGWSIESGALSSTDIRLESGALAQILLGGIDFSNSKIGLRNDGSGKLASGGIVWDTSGLLTLAKGLTVGTGGEIKDTSNTYSLKSSNSHIANWQIGTNTLSSSLVNPAIVLDRFNQKIIIGVNGEITLDGVNKIATVGTGTERININGNLGLIESNGFTSGTFGRGWRIDKTGRLEAQDGIFNGAVRTATFIKDTISAIGGKFLFTNSDTLEQDLPGVSTTLTISGNDSFNLGDILRIKSGLDDEFLKVTAKNVNTYTVTRDFKGIYGGSPPSWTKGTTVVNTKQTDQGFIMVDSDSTFAPFIDVITRTSNTVADAFNTQVRLGRLDGIIPVSTGERLIGFGLYAKDTVFVENGTVTGGIIQTSPYDISDDSIKLDGSDNKIHCKVNEVSDVIVIGEATDFFDNSITPGIGLTNGNINIFVEETLAIGEVPKIVSPITSAYVIDSAGGVDVKSGRFFVSGVNGGGIATGIEIQSGIIGTNLGVGDSVGISISSVNLGSSAGGGNVYGLRIAADAFRPGIPVKCISFDSIGGGSGNDVYSLYDTFSNHKLYHEGRVGVGVQNDGSADIASKLHVKATSGDILRCDNSLVERFKITNDGIVIVGGSQAISGDNFAHTAQSTENSHFGYFEARQQNGTRGFYLGWGTPGSHVDLGLENSNNLFINGGKVSIGQATFTLPLNVYGPGPVWLENNGEVDILFNDTLDNQQWQAGTNGFANGFYIYDSSLGYDFVVKKSTGNIGIGLNNINPGAKLDILADSIGAGGWYKAIEFSQGASSAITHPGGGLLFGLHSNRNFYFADILGGTFQKYVMVIDANANRTGIGSVPTYSRLEIHDPNAGATQTDFTQSLLRAGTNTVYNLLHQTYTPGYFWSTIDNISERPKAGIWLYQRNDIGTFMLFGTSENYSVGITNIGLSIDSSGNVGMGNGSFTGNPIPTHLYVKGNSQNTLTLDSINYPELTLRQAGIIKSYYAIATTSGGYTTTSTAGDVIYRVESGNHLFLFQQLERMRINNDGKVGINETSPSRRLSVRNDGSGTIVTTASEPVTIINRNTTTATMTAIRFAGTNIGNTIEYPTAHVGSINFPQASVCAGGLYFATTDTSGNLNERMRITNTGNVGIGITNPTAKLEVSHNGGNGDGGLQDYGLVTTNTSGQATIGAEVLFDSYANLNLGSNISGTRRFWHISKRPTSENHSLKFFYFDGASFGGSIVSITPTPASDDSVAQLLVNGDVRGTDGVITKTISPSDLESGKIWIEVGESGPRIYIRVGNATYKSPAPYILVPA